MRSAEPLSMRQAWYNPFIREKSLADFRRYEAQGLFGAQEGRALRGVLERFYENLSSAVPVLNHGDITMDNLLWHGGSVVSLIDFETSVIAPPQLDLHSMANLAFFSEGMIYVEDTIELFRPLLSQKGEVDLLLGYAVLFRQRFLEFWLEKPKGKPGRQECYRKLVSLSDGKGGYLAEVIAACGHIL